VQRRRRRKVIREEDESNIALLDIWLCQDRVKLPACKTQDTVCAGF